MGFGIAFELSGFGEGFPFRPGGGVLGRDFFAANGCFAEHEAFRDVGVVGDGHELCTRFCLQLG